MICKPIGCVFMPIFVKTVGPLGNPAFEFIYKLAAVVAAGGARHRTHLHAKPWRFGSHRERLHVRNACLNCGRFPRRGFNAIRVLDFVCSSLLVSPIHSLCGNTHRPRHARIHTQTGTVKFCCNEPFGSTQPFVIEQLHPIGPGGIGS